MVHLGDARVLAIDSWKKNLLRWEMYDHDMFEVGPRWVGVRWRER